MSGRQYKVALFRLMDEFYNTHWTDMIAHAFKSAGHEVRFIDIFPPDDAISLMARIRNYKPDFCVSQNASVFEPSHPRGIDLEILISSEKIPVLYWFTDYPDGGTFDSRLRWRIHPYPQNGLFIVPEPNNESFFKERGLPVHYVPPGVDLRLKDFKPDADLAKELACEMSFVAEVRRPDLFANEAIKEISGQVNSGDFPGTCEITLRQDQMQEIGDRWLEFRTHLSDLESLIISFYQLPCLSPEQFKTSICSFYKSVGDRFGFAFSGFLQLWFQRFSNDYSMIHMINHCRELEPMGLKVFGPRGWSEILTDGGASLCRKLYPAEALTLYSASKMVFSYQPLHFQYSMHENELLSGAMGTLPLIHYREQAAELFKPDEIITWKVIEEAKDYFKYYLKHETERKTIANKMRTRIFEEHTLIHRVKQNVKHLEEDFGISKRWFVPALEVQSTSSATPNPVPPN
ncbi:MAG: CgeB family protein [Bacteriovoracaceae bacterium]|nr:CgeB family protein [Bacteriovoracaceae bacterium]